MKTFLFAAIALSSLASTAAYAGSEDYPEPITRPIMSTMPSADVGPNGAAFGSTTRVQLNNANVVLNNSSEAEADSIASFPSPTNDKPVYAIKAPSANHG